MKTLIATTMIIGIAWTFSANHLAAQQTQNPRPQNPRSHQARGNQAAAAPNQGKYGPIAVMDLARVFKEHKRHQTKLDEIKKRAKVIQNESFAKLNQLQQQVRNAASSLQGDKLKTFELEHETKIARLKTETRQKKIDLIKEEAGVFLETYKEIKSIAKQLCQQYQFRAILRQDSPASNPQNPDAVMTELRNGVIHCEMDVTATVFEIVNRPNNPGNDRFTPKTARQR